MLASIFERGVRARGREAAVVRFAGVVVTALVYGGAVSCGATEGAPVPADSRHSVMVIDNGIDTTSAALQGKVAAAFTVVCDSTGGPDPGSVGVDLPDAGAGDDAGAPFADLKAQLIAALGVADDSCHLREGIDAKMPFAASHTSQRQAWNDALRADTLPQTGFEGVMTDLDKQVQSMPFHGTATAGTMAYGIPWLQMVLVELPLATSAEISAAFTCPVQSDIDLVVALLSDPDVRAAFLARPLPSLDRELADLRSSRGVSLVNESFGPLSRYGFERLELTSTSCRLVDVDAYFRVVGELQRTYDQQHAEPGVLVVRSAGNDGALLNTGDDGPQCHPGDEHQVLVGSYGMDGERSSFTNFGDCVDVYAPGEYIVAPLPGDWLTVLSGTSFSAPLVARLLALTAPAPFEPQTARAYLQNLRLANRNIAIGLFPPELVFDIAVAASRRALTAGSSSPASSGMGSPVTTRALNRALWPLRWAARRR
jgi:subtilase family protein